jgi:two-component system, cell cycle response regulator DivK
VAVTLAPSSRRVLLVEDDDQSRTALQMILEEEGFYVCSARDGGEGIQLVPDFRPDVIILDLALPGINGFDAAQLLKAGTETSEIPLIAVTASWLGEDGDRLRRIGFDRAFRKPFSPSALLEELRNLLW